MPSCVAKIEYKFVISSSSLNHGDSCRSMPYIVRPAINQQAYNVHIQRREYSNRYLSMDHYYKRAGARVRRRVLRRIWYK